MKLSKSWPVGCLAVISHFCEAQDPIRPFPLPDSYLSTTSILNHSKYVSSLDEPQWYLDNIPFIDFPDSAIQDVYYYRASVIKRHLKFAHEGHGWSFTEFIHPVAWASKFQTIPDSAPHHMVEVRWLRNPNYVRDLIQLYTRAGIEAISGITYTHYNHRAIYEAAEALGDTTFLTSQLGGMIDSYNLWNATIDNTTHLYHRNPLQDAQEYSLPGWVTGGPGGGPVESWNSFDNDYNTIWLGPETYRPNFNAYMVAGARAIANVAQLAGNSSVATQWNQYADGLYNRMVNTLYDNDLNFWIDVVQGTNLDVVGRQMIGYFPYRFDIGTGDDMVRGLEAGLTTDEFITAYGPTTLEQTNPYYTALKNVTYCCLWQGQSWPFSTSVYLGTLARLARNNLSTVATPELFYEAMRTYALTNYKDDIPYTAESHYPTINEWSGDTTNHSEHYLHSTYFDNVFTNLLGIIPALDNRLELRPLVPSNWSYFAVENLPYHGSLISLLYDRNGSFYSTLSHSPGLSIYLNGALIHNQATLAPVNVTLPSNSTSDAQKLSNATRYENILANPNAPHGLPNVSADWTFSSNGDLSPYEPWKMNDGLLWYDTTPDNRWTNNQSTTPFNTVMIRLPRARNISSVSLAIIDDTDRMDGIHHGGVVTCPAAIRVTIGNGSVVAERNPWTECKGNSLNTVLFSPPIDEAASTNASSTPATGTVVETDAINITMSNQLRYAFAISEVQIWVPANPGPRYEAEDGLLGTFVGGFEGRALGMNNSIVDGGVELYENGWAEIADVRKNGGNGGAGTLTVIGGGNGSVNVTTNFQENYRLTFDGNASQTLDVDYLYGGNVVTIFQTSGTPWIDAIVVG
ncbi:MAG: hypothetical protein M1820_006826 [Bogoriella megaspora]|nr:MAG: hypothetical protein M1820_006826 [Bogoriella megaspora]